MQKTMERLHTQFDVHKVIVSSRNASANGLLQVVKKINESTQRNTSVSVRKVRESEPHE